MPKKILTYTLGVWYLLLFQIYPIVHLHWHDGEGLETCFFAVDYNRADHVLHHNWQDEDQGHYHNAHQVSKSSDFSRLTLPVQSQSEHCHHFHTKADFDHFVSKKSSDDRQECNDNYVSSQLHFPVSEYVLSFFPQKAPILIEFHFSVVPNKSPPVC